MRGNSPRSAMRSRASSASTASAASASYLLDKAWLEEHHAAVEFVYEVFGTDALVISYGMDAVRPPIRDYPPMVLD